MYLYDTGFVCYMTKWTEIRFDNIVKIMEIDVFVRYDIKEFSALEVVIL